MSYRPEVIADSSGKWTGNDCRFATHEEAQLYALDLGCRWTAVRCARVIESEDPVTYQWLDGCAQPIKPGDVA